MAKGLTVNHKAIHTNESSEALFKPFIPPGGGGGGGALWYLGGTYARYQILEIPLKH